MQRLYFIALDNIRRLAVPLLALLVVVFVGDAGLTGVVKMIALGLSLSIVGANVATFSFHSREFTDERALAEIYKGVAILVAVVIAGVYFAQLQ